MIFPENKNGNPNMTIREIILFDGSQPPIYVIPITQSELHIARSDNYLAICGSGDTELIRFAMPILGMAYANGITAVITQTAISLIRDRKITDTYPLPEGGVSVHPFDADCFQVLTQKGTKIIDPSTKAIIDAAAPRCPQSPFGPGDMNIFTFPGQSVSVYPNAPEGIRNVRFITEGLNTYALGWHDNRLILLNRKDMTTRERIISGVLCLSALPQDQHPHRPVFFAGCKNSRVYMITVEQEMTGIRRGGDTMPTRKDPSPPMKMLYGIDIPERT